MQKAIDQRVALERDMRAAIADKQFQLYYQLQINSSYHYLGAEALLRWPHPQRGMVSPLEFIPLAEESGLIIPIGQWVLESACKQLKEWQKDERTRDLTLAVNVSAIQFSHPSFVNDVLSTIQSYNIAPHRLKLELTESMLVNNIEEIIVIMKQLKDIGVQFSLDDFGTGYSSLQYLKKLPLDQLKIDQSFVRDLVKDTHDMSIVRTIIAMAKGLELDVIAEGVETVSQKNKLMSFGCHNFQGFLFSKPLPIEELNKKLGSQHSLLAKNPEKLEDPGIEL
jgi:EAL domain-containing protein (putative c-di-GMP-specific phosphodiesterase class I)